MLLKIAGAMALLLATTSHGADEGPGEVDICLCADVDACKEKMSSAFFPCVDECKPKVTEAGADFAAFHKCLEPFKGKVKSTLSCMEKHLNGSGCATEKITDPRDKLPKSGVESEDSLEFSEVVEAIKQLGIETAAKTPNFKGQELYACMRSCMQSKSEHCAKNLKCALFTPTEESVSEAAKTCAAESGIDSTSLKEMCECLAGAKGKELVRVCA